MWISISLLFCIEIVVPKNLIPSIVILLQSDIIKYKLDKGAIDLYFKPIIGSDAVECTINPKLNDYEIEYEDEDGLIHQFDNSNKLQDAQGNLIYKKTYIDDRRRCNKDYNEMEIKKAILDDKIRNTTNKLYKYDVLRTDRTTAGCGLEVRVPFLDSDFVSFAMNIAPSEKMVTKERIEKHSNKASQKWS